MIKTPQHPNIISLFYHSKIQTNGQVNIQILRTIQHSIVNTHRNDFFSTCCTAIFHLDSGATVHATNNKNDFVIYHTIKSNTHLAVGSTAQCEGFVELY